MTASINFSAGTTVTSTWLNAVDAATFDYVANPLLFGATGDGTTDDSTALTDAVATGKPVYLPKGYTFATTGNITGFVDNQVVFGGGKIKKIGATVQPMVLVPDEVEGVRFDNIEFDGNRTLFSFGHAVPAIAGYLLPSLIVTNCYFHDIVDGGIKLRDCANLIAIGNRFIDIWENGIELRNYNVDVRTGSAYTGTRPTVQGNHQIIGNHIEKVTRLEDAGTGLVDACGVFFAGSSSYPIKGITIQGNVFLDCLRHIFTENNDAGSEALDVSIVGNTFRGSVYGLAALSYGKCAIGIIGAKQVTIAKNTIRNPANYTPIGTDTAGIILSSSYPTTQNYDVLIEGNTIIDDTGATDRIKYGINVNSGNRVTVRNNTVSGASTLQIRYDSSYTFDVLLEGNVSAETTYSWGNLITVPFTKSNIAASATTALNPYGWTDDTKFVLPVSGKLVGVSARSSAAFTGTITVTPYSAGNPATNLIFTQADFTSQNAYKRVTSVDGQQTNAGEELRVDVTTNGAFTNTHDILVVLFIDAGWVI